MEQQSTHSNDNFLRPAPTTWAPVSDEQISALLKTDPQAAMTVMVEQYTGLILKTAERYLKNPEDIKECANDVFMEFYAHQDRFEPSKGSLATFLVTVTRNLAVSRYRKNRIRTAQPLSGDIENDRDEIQNTDIKIDLERALRSLCPEDAEIIRMKYYGGMTVQEIAESLDLPYETVKKRHQRSLRKLRTALLIGFILLTLLTACAYAVLRHFGIVPGFGTVSAPDIPVYALADAVTAENETGTYVIENGFFINGEILLTGTVHFHSEDTHLWRPSLAPDAPPEVAILQYGGDIHLCSLIWAPTSALDIGFEIYLELKLPEEPEHTVEMSLSWAGAEFGLSFLRSAPDSAQNYSCEIGERAGLLALPHWAEGRLLVDVYPLASDASGAAGPETVALHSIGSVLLSSDDGTALPGESCHTSFQKFHTWDFGSVAPGSYTLHLPYLILNAPLEPSFSIPVNLRDCQWEEREYQMLDTVISVTECRSLHAVPGAQIPESQEIAQEGFSYWLITISYERRSLSQSDCRLLPPSFSLDAPILRKTGPCNLGYSILESGEDATELLVWASEDDFDLTRFRLCAPDTVSLRWEHSFDIPITVPPED